MESEKQVKKRKLVPHENHQAYETNSKCPGSGGGVPMWEARRTELPQKWGFRESEVPLTPITIFTRILMITRYIPSRPCEPPTGEKYCLTFYFKCSNCIFCIALYEK